MLIYAPFVMKFLTAIFILFSTWLLITLVMSYMPICIIEVPMNNSLGNCLLPSVLQKYTLRLAPQYC